MSAGSALHADADDLPRTPIPAILAAAREGFASLPALVALASANPARLLGRPDLGRLEPGASGDLLVVDPSQPVARVEQGVREGEMVLTACVASERESALRLRRPE